MRQHSGVADCMRCAGVFAVLRVILMSCTDGPSVFVFVVESAADPAVAAVAALMQQQGAVSLQQQQWPAGVLSVWRQEQPGAAGRLVVTAQAGLASTCSQKIHK